jgi:hypothetical protein
MSIPKYYESESEFEQIHRRLKHYPCPFCRLMGCLILHGFLFGSDVDSGCTVKRGHRIFCSNRNDRRGCGRTCSMLLSHFIKHFLFTARTIWRFFLSIVSGICKMKSLNDTGASASQSAPYGLWNRLHANAAHIRTCLSRVSPPHDTCSSDPEIRTISHLYSVFCRSENPISAFQLAFQTSFFEVLPPKPGILHS